MRGERSAGITVDDPREREAEPNLLSYLLRQTEGQTDLGYGVRRGAWDRAGRSAVRRGAGERDKGERP